MATKNICNGYVWPRKAYDQKKKNDLKPMIQRVRDALIKQFGCRDDDLMVLSGDSFNDDESVIARLESANQEEIKLVGWEQAIRASLIDCMSSDYYHTFENRIDE